MDYIVADAVVVPPGGEAAFSEQVIRLPHCYLPTPDGRQPPKEVSSRTAAGLPEDALVYCAFNNPVKITPEVFAVWLQLLQQVPDTVLWLRADAPGTRANLQQALRRHAIDAARLVFAPAVREVADHVARCSLADLFLDTYPYNAHVTACDALLADVPLLTCAGRSMAARMGASLVAALGLPGLVTHSLAEYAARARELSDDRAQLRELRAAVRAARTRGPIFDPLPYCRSLERAYETAASRARAGLSPARSAIRACAARPRVPPRRDSCADGRRR
jgi:predicted O-linked N-acetylglucosamine transferase (SPINDLY family)